MMKQLQSGKIPTGDRKDAKDPFYMFVDTEAKSASGLYLAADTLKSID